MPSSNPAKDHHFVPQFLLRNFCNDHGKLHCHDRESPERGLFSSVPKNIFLEENLYSIENEQGQFIPELETSFSRLESDVAPILQKIRIAAREQKDVSLTPQEFENLHLFFYHQWTRVPENFSVFDQQKFEEYFNDAIEEFRKGKGGLTPEEEILVNDPEWKRRMHKNSGVEALSLTGQNVMSVFRSRGIVALGIRNVKKSFIIGSNPVIKLHQPNQPNLAHPKAGVWLPVSHDVMVGSIAVPPGKVFVGATTDNHIRYLNSILEKQSRTIAGRSSELISSLRRLK